MSRTCVLILLLAGCNGGGLHLPGADGVAMDLGGPVSDLGAACASATDTASCQAIAGCDAVGCPLCGGGTSFLFCISQGQPHGVFCSDPCELGSCSEIGDATNCAGRPDCYALFSGDLPCNSSGCQDHFVRCVDGPPVCGPSTTPCNGSCTMLTPSCLSGETEVYPSADQRCCAMGCVDATKCRTH